MTKRRDFLKGLVPLTMAGCVVNSKGVKYVLKEKPAAPEDIADNLKGVEPPKNKDLFVLTVPEGVNLWDPNDFVASEVLEGCEKMVRDLHEGRMDGAVLPYGYKLERV